MSILSNLSGRFKKDQQASGASSKNHKKTKLILGIPEEHYNNRWKILAVMCLSLLVVMVGNTALNVALPVLSKALNATNSDLQWMVDAYSLVFAGLLFTAGAFGDRFGRKGILLGGLALFGTASLYSGTLAETSTALIAARAAMGLAGAMIMPATLSIITNVFPTKERARAVGIWAGVTGAGVALGPLLTGFVLEHFSWHSVFLVNLPIILIAIIAVKVLVPRTSDPEHSSIDPIGAILSIVGLVSIVYAIIEAPTHGWLAGTTLGIGALGLISMICFVFWELRTKSPMLDVRLFKRPAFGISSLSLTLVFFALMGMFFSISILFQLIYGYSPLNSAVRTLPIAFTMMVGAPLSSVLVEKLGKRRVVSAGMLIVAVGTLMLSTIGVDSSYLSLVFGMIVLAFGMSIAMSPTTDLLMSSVPKNRAGMGSAMNDTTRELGGALGIAVLGSLLASQYGTKISGVFSGLPTAAKEAAEQSLAGAMAVGQKIGGTQGAALIRSAKEAWISGYQYSLLVGAAVIAVAAVIAFFGLPDVADDHNDPIPEEGTFED